MHRISLDQFIVQLFRCLRALPTTERAFGDRVAAIFLSITKGRSLTVHTAVSATDSLPVDVDAVLVEEIDRRVLLWVICKHLLVEPGEFEDRAGQGRCFYDQMNASFYPRTPLFVDLSMGTDSEYETDSGQSSGTEDEDLDALGGFDEACDGQTSSSKGTDDGFDVNSVAARLLTDSNAPRPQAKRLKRRIAPSDSDSD